MLIHTTEVGRSDSMEGRGSTLGTITAVTRTPITRTLQMILLMRAKDNCIARSLTRFAVHSQLIHLVKLRNFAPLPVGPGIELLEFTTSKTSKSMLSRSGVKDLMALIAKEMALVER